MEGERLATLGWLHGAAYPDAALDKAWRQLVYGAHHDAITGTESDQVYLDLLGGWREAYERGDAARRAAARHLAGLVDTADTAPPPGSPAESGGRAVVVFNTLAAARDGLVTISLSCPQPGPPWLELRDGGAAVVPALSDEGRRHPDGTLAEVTLTFRATGVPGLGYRTYWARPAGRPESAADTSSTVDGGVIENPVYRIAADPRRSRPLAPLVEKRPRTDQGTPRS